MDRFLNLKPSARPADNVLPDESSSNVSKHSNSGSAKSTSKKAGSSRGSERSTPRSEKSKKEAAKSTTQSKKPSAEKSNSSKIMSNSGSMKASSKKAESISGSARSASGSAALMSGAVKPTTESIRSKKEKSTPESVRSKKEKSPSGSASRSGSVVSNTKSTTSRIEKWSTDLVKHEPRSPPPSDVGSSHGSWISRPNKPQSWNDVKCFSHDKQGNPRPFWKIRELQIAAGKARSQGGAFEDYIPEESSLKREWKLDGDGGSKRPDGTDAFIGRPYEELLDYIENRGGDPPSESAVTRYRG